jgi:hypothetical protein
LDQLAADQLARAFQGTDHAPGWWLAGQQGVVEANGHIHGSSGLMLALHLILVTACAWA